MRKQLLGFKSLNSLIDESRRLGPYIPHDIEAVVGIPRSGMIPAYAIALSSGNLPVWSLQEFIANTPNARGHTRGQAEMPRLPEEIKKILLVDDAVLSGSSLIKAKHELSSRSLERIVTCAPYVFAGSTQLVDIAGEIIEAPSLYEWNFLSHGLIEDCCIDMDGVLCFDPDDDTANDEEKYKHFIKNAKPRYRFKHKVKAIVTSRLSKYRVETQDWLESQGIKYDKLYLLDAPDSEMRTRFELQAPFKARIYRDSEATCFIESELWQAQEIANLSGMSVICTDVMRLISPAPHILSNYWLRKTAKAVLRRAHLRK